MAARARSWLILKTTGVRVAVEGLDRVKPGTTYVFVANHQSHYDTPVVFSSLPFQLRIIAKESLERFPVLGWHLKRGGHLLVDRLHPDPAGILRAGDARIYVCRSSSTLKEPGRGWPRHAGSRPAVFCRGEAGLPVVPLAIVGTRGDTEGPPAHRTR
jgi:1-acyl-sn-glycerol-3-phosphate acyltransferase